MFQSCFVKCVSARTSKNTGKLHQSTRQNFENGPQPWAWKCPDVVRGQKQTSLCPFLKASYLPVIKRAPRWKQPVTGVIGGQQGGERERESLFGFRKGTRWSRCMSSLSLSWPGSMFSTQPMRDGTGAKRSPHDFQVKCWSAKLMLSWATTL